MISEQDWNIIKNSMLFSGMEQASLEAVFHGSDCRIVCFADREALRSPESREHVAGLILAGKATVTTPDPARNTLLRFLEPGAFFGIANLFSDRPYISRIAADGPCRALLIPESAIRTLLENDRDFLYRYLDFLSGRIRFLNQKIGYLTAGSAERRLALYLLSRGDRTVFLTDSISSLSELLDIGRASLYRAFDKLSEDGYIQKDGRQLTLLDPDGMLRAYH